MNAPILKKEEYTGAKDLTTEEKTAIKTSKDTASAIAQVISDRALVRGDNYWS